jgi:hypothetical protein
MPDDVVAVMIANFPNLAGLSILAFVLWRSDQNSERRYDEQVSYLRTLLSECLDASGQGRVADSERIS